jgi:hypothetical protein
MLAHTISRRPSFLSGRFRTRLRRAALAVGVSLNDLFRDAA